MNADEWDCCEVPLVMLAHLPHPSDRKLCLFGCACCLAGPQRENYRANYLKTMEWADRPSRRSLIRWWPRHGGYRLPERASYWARMWADFSTDLVPRRTQADFLRDIFGNPLRPMDTGWYRTAVYPGGAHRINVPAANPSWQTRTVTSLARLAYDGQDFSLLPVLADALEDAGCENAFVLDHCRSQGPHVRGCWVVDLVLGKD
jgi:hypothetical protein